MKTMKTLLLICVAISALAPGSLWASTTAEKKLELNGSSWDVVLMSAGSVESGVGEDIYTFQDGQFRSKALMARGFKDTNFVISLPGGNSDLAVWETMQTGNEGVVFLHGEWVKDKMWGTITEQLEGGRKIVDHTFITRRHWQPEVPKAKSVGEIKTVKIEPQKTVLSHASEDEFPVESSTSENKFLEEIEKFEKAQALKIAR